MESDGRRPGRRRQVEKSKTQDKNNTVRKRRTLEDTMQIGKYRESSKNQAEAMAVGRQPPKGRYIMVNNALSWKKIKTSSGEATIFNIHARSLELVRCLAGLEKQAKLAVEGNGSRKFEIFWDPKGEKCQRDIAWHLIACGLPEDTEDFDLNDEKLLAETLLGTPYEVAFDTVKKGQYENVKVMEVKPISASDVKKFQNLADFEELARVGEDPWYETKDFTKPRNAGGGSNGGGDDVGDGITQDDLDSQFGNEW